MTEQEIERIVEKNMDRLDLLFLAGAIGKQRYKNAVKQLDDWAAKQYAKIRSAA